MPPRRPLDAGRAIVAALSGPLGLFIVSIMLGGLLLLVSRMSGWNLSALEGDQERIFNVAVSAAVYTATLVLLWISLGRYLFAKESITQALGLTRRPTVKDLGVSIIAFGGYFLTSMALLALVSLIPGLNLEQPQNVGQTQPEMFSSYLIAFIGLVVLPPVFEELILRGFTYGALRKQVSFWISAVVVSAGFGVLHGQVNVAIDTFVLSLFLCALREHTGSIWAPIFLHALKNGLAFTLLFVLGLGR